MAGVIKAGEAEVPGLSRGYSRYALFVLVVVYVFNFVDRQILSILAEDIKADLGVTDAQIGFLYGTAFAVFYAVFGIPLARLADTWTRTRLISIGLGFWSAMTAASGFVQSFAGLATCRFGVGIGEASASPAANSLLADYFPPRLRATVIAIYSSGIYIGAGIGVFLGGAIVSKWNTWYPSLVDAPFGFAGWQVAFLVVGAPGIVAAVWVASLREPERGAMDGRTVEPSSAPFKGAFEELLTVLPPFTLLGLMRAGGKARDFTVNLGVASGMALGAALLAEWTDNLVQWVAVAIGFYGAFSWAQSLAKREPDTFRSLFRSKTVPVIILGFACMSFVSYGVSFWMPSFLIRGHGALAADVGMIYGMSVIVGGMSGVTLAGVLADKLYSKVPYGRLLVGCGSMLVCIPFVLLALRTDQLTVAYIGAFGYCFTSPMWMGVCFSTLVDLVVPQIRATVVAISILANTFVGLAIGPFMIGQISDYLVASGASDSVALGSAMMTSLAMAVIGVGLIVMAARRIAAGA